MSDEARQLVEQLVERFNGAIENAAHVAGISPRTLLRWVRGDTTPCESALDRIRIALQGDPKDRREARIQFYIDRAARGADLFKDQP